MVFESWEEFLVIRFSCVEDQRDVGFEQLLGFQVLVHCFGPLLFFEINVLEDTECVDVNGKQNEMPVIVSDPDDEFNITVAQYIGA